MFAIHPRNTDRQFVNTLHAWKYYNLNNGTDLRLPIHIPPTVLAEFIASYINFSLNLFFSFSWKLKCLELNVGTFNISIVGEIVNLMLLTKAVWQRTNIASLCLDLFRASESYQWSGASLVIPQPLRCVNIVKFVFEISLSQSSNWSNLLAPAVFKKLVSGTQLHASSRAVSQNHYQYRTLAEWLPIKQLNMRSLNPLIMLSHPF